MCTKLLFKDDSPSQYHVLPFEGIVPLPGTVEPVFYDHLSVVITNYGTIP